MILICAHSSFSWFYRDWREVIPVKFQVDCCSDRCVYVLEGGGCWVLPTALGCCVIAVCVCICLPCNKTVLISFSLEAFVCLATSEAFVDGTFRPLLSDVTTCSRDGFVRCFVYICTSIFHALNLDANDSFSSLLYECHVRVVTYWCSRCCCLSRCITHSAGVQSDTNCMQYMLRKCTSHHTNKSEALLYIRV